MYSISRRRRCYRGNSKMVKSVWLILLPISLYSYCGVLIECLAIIWFLLSERQNIFRCDKLRKLFSWKLLKVQNVRFFRRCRSRHNSWTVSLILLTINYCRSRTGPFRRWTGSKLPILDPQYKMTFSSRFYFKLPNFKVKQIFPRSK